MASDRLDTLARRMLVAREEYEAAYKAKAKAEEKKQKAEAEFDDALQKAKMPGGDFELGGKHGNVRLSRQKKTFNKVFDAEALEAWLREQKMEVGYIDSKFHQKALNALVKERLETKVPLPPGIEPTFTPYIKVERKKKK